MSEFLFITLGYVLAFGMAIGLVAFLQRGFFINFIKTKASRGKKLLVRIRSSLEDYYTIGEVSEGILTFKDITKEQRKISVEKGDFYRSLNINCVDLDDDTNTIIKRDGSIMNGFDAKKFNNLLVRALTKPKDLNKEEKLILILLFAIAAGVAFVGFTVFGVSNELQACVSNVVPVGEI